MATISGSIVGPMVFWMVLAFAEAVLIEVVDDRTGQLTIGGVTLIQTTGQIGQIRFILVGAMLMLLMVFRPQGIFGNRRRWRSMAADTALCRWSSSSGGGTRRRS